MSKKYNGLEIAIIGISGQFPGSDNHRRYWENLKEGKELISHFTDEELRQSGVPADTWQNERYVRRLGVLEKKDRFDHRFFGYTAGEAALMDPQIRVFHEHCWKALEDAGYSSLIEKYKIGLFAGAATNDCWKLHAYTQSKDSSVDPFYLGMIIAHNFISTLVSYKLNLRGPSMYVDTACSTSLSAVHLACRNLLTRECTLALAGGISLRSVKNKGYMFQEDMIYSRDGHCRTFDSQASGTVSGEGAGIVVLKRLNDALKDRDHIYAVIRSIAANNDGNNKVGYTAPSVKGQAECIATAQKLAGVDPRQISYVEAHGTATRLGDPVEIRALNEAFGVGGSDKFCAIGSVKTNMGHLGAAAGVSGLIKTALSLENRQIPASLHFSKPNPEIDFAGGPFYVNTELQEWKRHGEEPLLAGVSSLGIGGTNVHAILEEAPAQEEGSKGRPFQVLTISAKTEQSVLRYITDINHYLREVPDINLADMSYTLQTGRKHFGYRKAIAYGDREELLRRLEGETRQEGTIKGRERSGPVVFMCSGAGSQYTNMGRGLYEGEPAFRAEMDRGFALLKELTGEDYKKIFYPDPQAPDAPAAAGINNMLHTQPAIFLFGYALGQLMMSWGIKPQYLVGHSIGEYVAACLSGVFSFEDAMKLVVRRGQLMDILPAGAMVSVPINEAEAAGYTSDRIALAAINGPEQVVFSGEIPAIEALIDVLEGKDISCARIHASTAGHSHMMDAIVGEYTRTLESVERHSPVIPFLSNLTGTMITAEQATSVRYWTRHIRETVRFSDGIRHLLEKDANSLFVEIGGGYSLTSLVRQHASGKIRPASVNLVRHPKEPENDLRYLAERLGDLWTNGVSIDWSSYYKEEKRSRVSLPTYSFEGVRFPVEVDPLGSGLASAFTAEKQGEGAGAGQTEPYTTEGILADDPRMSAAHQGAGGDKLGRPDLATPYAEADTDTEHSVKQLLEQLFGWDHVGVDDNFFEWGGDSLKGMMLLKRIKKEFNVIIPLKDLFLKATIRSIAAVIDEVIWLEKDVAMENEIKI